MSSVAVLDAAIAMLTRSAVAKKPRIETPMPSAPRKFIGQKFLDRRDPDDPARIDWDYAMDYDVDPDECIVAVRRCNDRWDVVDMGPTIRKLNFN